jgi:hypothetical protein
MFSCHTQFLDLQRGALVYFPSNMYRWSAVFWLLILDKYGVGAVYSSGTKLIHGFVKISQLVQRAKLEGSGTTDTHTHTHTHTHTGSMVVSKACLFPHFYEEN